MIISVLSPTKLSDQEFDPMAALTSDSNEPEERTSADMVVEHIVKTMKKPSRVRKIEDVHAAMQANIPALWKPLESLLSVKAQLLITDVHNPFLLVFQDDPGAGKTQTVNLIKPLEETVHFVDRISPKSFVTNIASVKKEDLEEIDLLNTIRNGVIVMPDFATVLGGGEEEVREVISIWTRIMDGEGYQTSGGRHGKRGYKKDMMFMAVACTTHLSPEARRIMAGFGPRMFFNNLGIPRPTAAEITASLRDPTSFRKKHTFCQAIVCDFVRTLWMKHPNGIVWDRKNDAEEAMVLIGQLAEFLTFYRGEVFAYHQKDEFGRPVLTHSNPSCEHGQRPGLWLHNLARGHAALYGRTSITMEDMPIVIRTVFDTAPGLRPKFLRSLLRAKGMTKTDHMADEMGVGEVLIKRVAIELAAVGMVDAEKDEGGYYEKADQYSIPADATIGERPWRIKLRPSFQWIIEEKALHLFGTNGLL